MKRVVVRAFGGPEVRDLGVAVYLHSCVIGRAGMPLLDIFWRGRHKLGRKIYVDLR